MGFSKAPRYLTPISINISISTFRYLQNLVLGVLTLDPLLWNSLLKGTAKPGFFSLQTVIGLFEKGTQMVINSHYGEGRASVWQWP